MSNNKEQQVTNNGKPAIDEQKILLRAASDAIKMHEAGASVLISVDDYERFDRGVASEVFASTYGDRVGRDASDVTFSVFGERPRDNDYVSESQKPLTPSANLRIVRGEGSDRTSISHEIYTDENSPTGMSVKRTEESAVSTKPRRATERTFAAMGRLSRYASQK
jgi:hypothetical protein